MREGGVCHWWVTHPIPEEIENLVATGSFYQGKEIKYPSSILEFTNCEDNCMQ